MFNVHSGLSISVDGSGVYGYDGRVRISVSL